MTLKDAHDRAMAWSHSPPRRTAVVHATATEVIRPFYWTWDYVSIPTDAIVATYFNGKRETPIKKEVSA